MENKINAEDIVDFLEKQKCTTALPESLNATPENAANGLAKLVLTLIELLRELLEKQALRRVEEGGLSEEQMERMGLTFIKMEEKMEEFKAFFDLTNEDLKLDLGIVGL